MKQQKNLLNKASKEFDWNHPPPLKKLQILLRPTFHVTNKIITEKWPKHNFSLQYQYHIKQTGVKNNERYQSGDCYLIEH